MVTAGVCAGFGEISGKTLLWDGRQTLLQQRLTEEADGVFFYDRHGLMDQWTSDVRTATSDQIRRHLVVQGGESVTVWCEHVDMAGGARVS